MQRPSEPALVQAELERILASPGFIGSERLSRFLRFVVDSTLAGRSAEIKEYVVGVEVYDKSESYDPSSDSTVRGEASKLRLKLRLYYETEGRDDPVVISIPKGTYVPVFEIRRDQPAPATTRRYKLAVALVLAVSTGVFYWSRISRPPSVP